MQVFGKADAFLGGIDEAIAILKLCSEDWSALEVPALYDGDAIAPWEVVLEIEGPYDDFAHLETLYLGVLARRTRVGTNTRRVVDAARPKQVMFFPARHDHWLVQTGDGYAAHIAGAIGVSTDAQASWWGSEGIGTVPHGLIAAYGGDTVLASQKFLEHMDAGIRLVTLVDFENDCVRTSLELADALGDRALRRPARHQRDAGRPVGDSADGPLQAHRRETAAGAERARRARRGGASRTCTSWCPADSPSRRSGSSRRCSVPVDAYGVGSSLFQGRFDFTADVVQLEGNRAPKWAGSIARARGWSGCDEFGTNDNLLGRRHPGRLHHGRRQARRAGRRSDHPESRGADRLGASAPASASSPPPTITTSATPRSPTIPTGRRRFRRTACAARRSAEDRRRPCSAHPLLFQPVPLDPASRRHRVRRHDGDFLLNKPGTDVFRWNPNAATVLATLAPDRIVVYGVATDFCTRAAVDGLARLRPRRSSSSSTMRFAASTQRPAPHCSTSGARLGTP